MGGGTKGKVIQGIMNLIRSKYGEEAIDTLENLYSSGKLKLNDLKKQFMEDREAVESFQQREKLSNMPDEIKVEPRKILDVPEVPEGFSTSKEKLLEQFPEIDEEFAETMMEMDKDLLGRTIMMLKNRRLNPELYDELLEKYGDTLEFQSKFDEAIRKTKNAYGGLIDEGVSTLFMEK